MAQNSVSEVLCRVGSYLWGPVGSAISMLGVIALGLMAMFGRVQYSSVLTIMVGVALIFGAPGVLDRLGISVGACQTTVSASGIINSEFYKVFACMVSWFVGPIGKAVATLGIITLGLFATYGRMSWHQALLVSVGIAVMFGSVGIVQSMGVPVYTATGAIGNMDFNTLCPGGLFSVEQVFCNVLSYFTGAIGKGIGMIAVIILGIGMLFAKTSWNMVMVVAVGIALIYGSSSIVTAIGGRGNLACTTGDISFNATGTNTTGTNTTGTNTNTNNNTNGTP